MKYYATKISDKGNIAVDDTILVKDYQTAAGSRILEGYKPLFSAEAVTRLEDKGYVVSGKTNVGEFGLDLVGEFSYYGETDEMLKGAAAELVKKGEVKAAIAVDVNGAPRRAAALSDVDFLKATYGTVSRYGVVSTAASGEQIGVYAQNAKGVAEIMSVIAGHDSKDGTSLPTENYDYTPKNPEGKKVCLIKELYVLADKETKAKIDGVVTKLAAKGVKVSEVSLDIFENANTAWQILMTAETCNNISRYDGVKFGHRAKEYRNIDELYVNSRTEGFNFLTKSVILYGSDVLSKNRYKDCYDKSLRVRRVIADEMKKLFEKYDAVLTPVCYKSEFNKYDIMNAFELTYKQSVFTSVANLVGLPAMVSGGVQFIGEHFSEADLLGLAESIEG